MRKTLFAAVAFAALATAGCGIDVPSADDLIDQAESAAASAAADATSGLPDGVLDGSGDVDCSGIDAQLFAEFGVAAQLMPQVSVDSIDSMREGDIFPYQADSVATVLDQLEVLRGHDGLGMGDPGDSIDYFRANNDALIALLAQDPVDPAAIDTYRAEYSNMDTWVKMQIALSAAYGEYCPSV